MESEVWNVLSHLLNQTVGQSASNELEKVRSAAPINGLKVHSIVYQFDFLLRTLDEKHRQKLSARVLSDVSVWVEQIWRYA